MKICQCNGQRWHLSHLSGTTARQSTFHLPRLITAGLKHANEKCKIYSKYVSLDNISVVYTLSSSTVILSGWEKVVTNTHKPLSSN